MCESIEDTRILSSDQQFAESFFALSEPAVPLAFGAASHVGNVRSQNQDHFAIVRIRRSMELLLANLSAADLGVVDAHSYAMVVADGMGGMKSGEFASRLALQTMLELAAQATSWVMKLTDFDAQQIHQRANAYVQRINAALQEHALSDPAKSEMGTTWTSAHLFGKQAVIVHLGDSRAYLLRNRHLCQLTRDETMAQALIDSGMEPERVRKFSHVLINSFGGGYENPTATILHLEFAAEDQLLLCTDGVTNMVPDDDIASELSRHTTPQAACDALVGRALKNGGKDNVTVVLASTSR